MQWKFITFTTNEVDGYPLHSSADKVLTKTGSNKGISTIENLTNHKKQQPTEIYMYKRKSMRKKNGKGRDDNQRINIYVNNNKTKIEGKNSEIKGIK